jgi:hypothetical protein
MTGDDISDELEDIKQELRQQRIKSTKQQIERRTENVQVLFALSIIGATATILSGNYLSGGQGPELVNVSYWNVVLYSFLISNIVFLFVKLTTLPIRGYFGPDILGFFHEFVEPMLYFFTIVGLSVALPIGLVMEYSGFNISTGNARLLAILLMLLPLFASVVFSIYKRANDIMEQFISEYEAIASISDMSVDEAEIDEDIIRIAILLSPTVPSIVLLKLLLDTINELRGTSGEPEESENPSEWSLRRFLNESLDNELDEEAISEIERIIDDMDEEDMRRVIRNWRKDLRRKRETGQLDEEYQRKEAVLNALHEYSVRAEKTDE